MRTLVRVDPSRFFDLTMASTMASSLCLTRMLRSRLMARRDPSPISVVVIVLPMTASPETSGVDGREAVFLQLIVATDAHPDAVFDRDRALKLLCVGAVGPLFVFVCLILDGPEETALQGFSVDDERVLLVEPGPAHDADDCVDAGWSLPGVHELVHARRDEGALWRDEDVHHCVHSHRKVEPRYSDRLFSHRGLVSVSWRLVVIGKWDERCAHSVNERRVQFAVRVVSHIGRPEGNAQIHLLLLVDVFDDAGAHQVFPQVFVGRCVSDDARDIVELAGHEHRPEQASRIGVDADGVVDVRYGRVEWQHVLASHASQCLEEHLGVFVCACTCEVCR